MANIDLTTNGWVDLIFEGRNHEYGAYKLRKGTPKRNIYSIIVIAILAALCFTLFLYNFFMKKPNGFYKYHTEQ